VAVAVHDEVADTGRSQKVDEAAGTKVFSEALSFVKGAARDLSGNRIAVGGRTTLSGYGIARQGHSRAAETLSGIVNLFGYSDRDPRKIRYLYAIPALAVVLAWLITVAFAKSAFLRRIPAFAACGIAVFVVVRLTGATLSNEFAQVQLLYGLWGTCGAFFALGFFGLK